MGGYYTADEIDAKLAVVALWSLLSNYAGMYRHDSVAVTEIQEVNDWHLINGFTVGLLGGGWAFHAGGQLALTAQANNGDGKTQITCALHGLTNGDVVSISGTTSYDGVWVVEQVTANTFVIDTAWVADEGNKTGEHGSHFSSAATASVGKYLLVYSLSIKPLSANCVVEASVFQNATQIAKSGSITKLGAVTDYQLIAGHCIGDIALNDVCGMAIRNNTDGGDFVIIDGNITLTRVG